MGLDARVHCDCAEKGRLVTPHPFPDRLYIEPDGRPEVRTDDLPDGDYSVDDAHDAWYYASPCQHETCCLVNYYIGNIALVGLIRSIFKELEAESGIQLPVLRNQVVYSGIHCGDRIEGVDVIALSSEIEQLKKRDWNHLNPRDRDFLNHFLHQMTSLYEAALRVGKPISF